MPATTTEETTEIYSEKELADQEALLQESRERLAEAREREEGLSERIADQMAAGEEPDGLREERREVRVEIEDLERAIPLLERRIQERRAARLRHRVRERMEEIEDRHGELVEGQDQRVQRAVDALETARDQLRAAGEAYAAGRALESEASVLADVFDLEAPEFRQAPNPKAYDEIKGAGAVSGWLDWTPKRPLGKAERMASGAGRARDEEPRSAIRRLEGIDVDLESPAADLLNRLQELKEEAGE